MATGQTVARVCVCEVFTARFTDLDFLSEQFLKLIKVILSYINCKLSFEYTCSFTLNKRHRLLGKWAYAVLVFALSTVHDFQFRAVTEPQISFKFLERVSGYNE